MWGRSSTFGAQRASACICTMVRHGPWSNVTKASQLHPVTPGQFSFLLTPTALHWSRQFSNSRRMCFQPLTILCKEESTKSSPHIIAGDIVKYKQLMDILRHIDPLAERCSTVVIDVREPSEIQETGVIPKSQALPVGQVEEALGLGDQAFKQRYGFQKPLVNDQMVFYCRSGARSGQAMEVAKRLGFRNAKNYRGSWLEYSSKTSQ
ncbi:hypothetical protein IWQ61_000074 [Dispira simplex]|nr:hypothetical protein IWQ61_000074 [Dispira simplex]